MFPEILPEDETPWLNAPAMQKRHSQFELQKKQAAKVQIEPSIAAELEGIKQVFICLFV
jgi:hypothetical protein